MATVIYAPEADDDLIGIVDFIARDKPGAARDWLAKIRQTCELLATQPGMGELRKLWRSRMPLVQRRQLRHLFPARGRWD